MPESTFFRGLQPPKFFVFGLCFLFEMQEKHKHKGGRGGQKKNLCVGFLWVSFSLFRVCEVLKPPVAGRVGVGGLAMF